MPAFYFFFFLFREFLVSFAREGIATCLCLSGVHANAGPGLASWSRWPAWQAAGREPTSDTTVFCWHFRFSFLIQLRSPALGRENIRAQITVSSCQKEAHHRASSREMLAPLPSIDRGGHAKFPGTRFRPPYGQAQPYWPDAAKIRGRWDASIQNPPWANPRHRHYAQYGLPSDVALANFAPKDWIAGLLALGRPIMPRAPKTSIDGDRRGSKYFLSGAWFRSLV